MEKVKCLVLGSGPAGYTAAIYTQRAGIPTMIYEGLQPGGQLTTTTIVENFPGFPQGIDANVLMNSIRQQAINYGAEIRAKIAIETDLSKMPYYVKFDDGSEIQAETIIIATGATAKYLGIPDEVKYKGLGVSACATCDGFFYRNKKVAVVGGGDTACEEAIYLSSLASMVYMIVRKPFLRASQIMQDRLNKNEKIKILFETNTLGLYGEHGVEGINLVYRKGLENEREYKLPINGFFLAIGHKPNSEIFKPWIKMDKIGYIVTEGKTPKTNIPGVFAAGDVADPIYRQAIIAAASGCSAGIEVEKYLSAK